MLHGHRVNTLSVTLRDGRRLDLSRWSSCRAQGYYITAPGTWTSRSVVGQSCFKKDERKKRKKEEGEESSVYTVKCFYYTHTHTHTPPRSEPNKTKKNCFLTFHMLGWCQTLLLDSQKSLLFLCKREVLSRRECFRTLIYLEMI